MLLALSAAILATIGMVWVYQHQKSEIFQVPSLTDLLKKIDIHIPEDAPSSQKTENPLALSYYSSHTGRDRSNIPPDVQIPPDLATTLGIRFLPPGVSVPPTLVKSTDAQTHDVYIPLLIYPTVPLPATAQIPKDTNLYKIPGLKMTPTSSVPPSNLPVGEPRPLPESPIIPPVEIPPGVSVPPGMFIPPDSDIQIPQDTKKTALKEKHMKRKVASRHPKNVTLATPEILNTTFINSKKSNYLASTEKVNSSITAIPDVSNSTFDKFDEINSII